MADSQMETTSLQVPQGMGYLIGNTLRQYAMRGTNTWQPAAYKISGKDGTFGLSEGYHFSVFDFLDGRILSQIETGAGTEKLCQFELKGEDYICDGMVLKNLGKLRVPRMDVCLVYASGSRTENQNYAVAKRLCPNDVDDFVAVPSRHTPTVKFSFQVKPYDQGTETLIIEATPGVVNMAQTAAVESLSGLHI